MRSPDEIRKSLSIWFADPKKEVVSEEIGDGTIVSKDKSGKVIGFEKLYITLPKIGSKITSPIDFSLV